MLLTGFSARSVQVVVQFVKEMVSWHRLVDDLTGQWPDAQLWYVRVSGHLCSMCNGRCVWLQSQHVGRVPLDILPPRCAGALRWFGREEGGVQKEELLGMWSCHKAV